MSNIPSEPKNVPEPFQTPDTSEPDVKIEHTVLIDSVGGATVMSSESLNFKNLEMIYDKVNEENIKKSITHFRPHLNVKGVIINVVDIRNK